MSRYFVRATKAKAFWVSDDVWEESVRPDTPQVCDHEATDTGLLDVNGDPIMRAPNPIGFGKDDEW